MKLPLAITAHPTRVFAQVETGSTVEPTGGVAGSEWSSPYGIGQSFGEEPADMIPPQRFLTYNRMRREDSAVKSSLWFYKLPGRSAVWQHQPASSDPVDRMIMDAIEWNFGSQEEPGIIDLSFDEQLQQAYLHLDFGSMWEEMIVADPQEWVDADGDTHVLQPIGRLAPRFPATIRMPDGIVTDPRTGLPRALIQTVPRTMPIPGENLCWYTLEREGTDWLGTSMLRPMYGPWRLKQHLLNAAGVGWDRYAFGTPVVRYPQSGGPDKKHQAENIGRGWRTHERGWVVLEGTKEQGWDVDIVGGSGAIGDPTPLLNVYNDEIAKAGLQHFSSLGRTGTGSRAVGDVQVEPFYQACQVIADAVAMQRRRRIYRRFVDINFGTEFSVPKLSVQKVHARNVQIIAAAIAALADAGFNFADPDTQNDVRDMLDLRRLPEAAVAAIETGQVGIEHTLPPLALPAERGSVPAAVTPESHTVTLQPLALSGAREGDDLGH